MTEMIRETNLIGLGRADDVAMRPRTGLAFVPCLVCRAPLDLVLLAESDAPQICDHHFSTEGLSLR